MIKSFILKATSGPYAGKEVKVENGQLVRVGRAPKAGAATGDPYMSGEHFALECTPQTCRIRDLNSRHGTFLNRERISEALLHEDDQVYAGQTTLVVHIEEASPTVGTSGVRKTTETPQHDRSEQPGSAPGVYSAPSPVSPPNPGQVSTSSLPDKQNSRKSFDKPASVPERKAPPPVPPLSQPGQGGVVRPMNPAARALEMATAATPEGRLLSILVDQREPLFALLDAAKESSVPALLRSSGEEYQSLYAGEELAESAPYLVYLPPSSSLLESLVRKGWGHGWIVYLTCPLPLKDVRNYFRQSLMIKMPDGREFFSRFYDPRFFRGFLRGCTVAEAERFFGPVSTYLMEADNSEILLEFAKSNLGVDTKERLLLIPGT